MTGPASRRASFESLGGGVPVSEPAPAPSSAARAPARPSLVGPHPRERGGGRDGMPWVLTRLVGRDRQVGDLLAVLGGHRLVTLTGMGGVGKSRVALAVAEQVRSSGRRVVWVDVASLPAEYP